jgi:hypothetical protein
MVAYKLTSAVFTTVILFSFALFLVSGYGGAVAMGADKFYGDLCFIVSFYALVVFTPPSYFVDHHLIFLYKNT